MAFCYAGVCVRFLWGWRGQEGGGEEEEEVPIVLGEREQLGGGRDGKLAAEVKNGDFRMFLLCLLCSSSR